MIALTLLLLAQQPDTAVLESRVKVALEEAVKDAPGFVGMTAAFVLPNGKLGQIALGMSDKAKATSMKPTDRILAGSIGKTFFAALALQLVEKKQLDLDALASKYIGDKPYFRRIPNHETVTIRHLMNHTSGIPEHVEGAEVVAALKRDPDKDWHPADIVQFLLDKKPLFDPGKDWSYADANYIVLGLVLDQITVRSSKPANDGGQTYREIEQRFLQPLSLKDTSPSIYRRMPGLVQGYSMPGSPFLPEGPVLKDGLLAFNPSFEWGGGGYISTSGDLARWAWNLWGGKVLKPESLAEMLKGVPAKTGPQDKYGLGAMIEPTSVGVSYGHEGWFPGYLSQTMYLPDHKIAIAVQFNTDNQRGLKHRTRWFCDLIAKILTTPLQ